MNHNPNSRTMNPPERPMEVPLVNRAVRNSERRDVWHIPAQRTEP